MKEVLLVILIPVLIVGYGLFSYEGGKAQQLREMRAAYKTCLVSHYEINGDSEQACGDALDATSTEFLCNQTGNCWLEVK